MMNVLALLFVGLAAAASFNDRRFFCSNYDWIGKIISQGKTNPPLLLEFNQTSVQHGLASLRLGCSRYPGGNPTNCWDWSNSSLLAEGNFCLERFLTKAQLVSESAAIKAGVWSPSAFEHGSPSLMSPSWDFNLLTLPPNVSAALIDTLKEEGVHVELCELGNEYYLGSYDYRFPNASSYIDVVRAVAQHIRDVEPAARISIPLDFHPLAAPSDAANSSCVYRPGMKPWNDPLMAWLKTREGQRLVDDVTVHDYALKGKCLTPVPKEHWPGAMTAWPQAALENAADAMDKAGLSAARMWMTEFNIPFNQQENDPGFTFLTSKKDGLLHAMYWLTHVLTGVALKPVYTGMWIHPTVMWPPKTCDNDDNPGGGLLCLGPDPSTPPHCSVVAQVFAHVSQVTSSGTLTAVTPSNSDTFPVKLLGRELPCLQAAAGSWGAVVTNRCDHDITSEVTLPTPPQPGTKVAVTAYAENDAPGTDGRWAECTTAEASLPWTKPMRPLRKEVAVSGGGLNLMLPALSITVASVE